MSELDWASQLAHSITHACCAGSQIAEDLIASELRRIEATGYSRGYEAAQAVKTDLQRNFEESDITQPMIQAGRYAANLNDGTLARIFLAMRTAELSGAN